jgi:hypothetical protein
MRIGPVELKPHDPRSPNGSAEYRALEEILSELDILEVDPENGYVVGARRLSHPLANSTTEPVLREIGSTGTRWRRVLGGQEYNPDVRGITGYNTFDRMRRSDATVSQALKTAKTPVLEAEWWVDPANNEDELAVRQAEFISKALFEWQSIGWMQFMTETLTMLDFGYSFFEKVFTFHRWKGHDRVIWRKFAPRAITDVDDWEYDAKGGPDFVRMTNFDGFTGIIIPIEKLLVFSYRRESGNVEGISALREMYKHWYYKENLYKVDAIQKERHGVGIPIIKLPPNFSTTDKQLADELGRNLRTNEWAHVVLPPLWELEFAQVGGHTVDVLQSINHHDAKLIDSVMGGFLTEMERSDAQVMLDIFMKSSRYLADIIREVINKFAIPELISYNWPNVNDFPELRVRHIGQVTDLRTISFTVRNLVGAGVIKPDDQLEEFMRDLNDLPRRDKATTREVATPQQAGGARPPRQSQAGNQRIQPGSNAGNDQSGG